MSKYDEELAIAQEGMHTPTKDGAQEAKYIEDDGLSIDFGDQGSAHASKGRKNVFTKFTDSFKPPKDYGFDTTGMSKQEINNKYIAQCKPKLKKRHMYLMAATSGIGTGLYIATGNSLKNAGPASLVIAFALISLIVVTAICSLGELGVRYPAHGSFNDYMVRFIHPSWGFAVGWIYTFGWIVVLPLEIIAAAMLLQYWKGDDNAATRVNPVAWVALFYAAILIINLFGGRVYGEVEFVLGTIKLAATVGFIIFAIVITAGGGPNPGPGAKYWKDPGPFTHFGFKAVVQVIANTAIACGGAEISGLAAAETPQPRKALASAVKHVFWRSLIFMVFGTLMLGFVVPSDNPDLGTSSDGSGSPYVVAIKLAGVRGLDSVFNVVLLCSVFHVGVSSTFLASRCLVGMSLQGMAPSIFAYVDRRGRPLGASCLIFIIGLLCFTAASPKYAEVFDWLFAFSSLSFLFVWGSINVAHLMTRWAMHKQGISTNELVYKSALGIIGSATGAVLAYLVLILQVWPSLFPLGEKANAEKFFTADLSIPVVFLLFFGHMIWTRSGFRKPSTMDITSNIRVINVEELRAEERHRAARRKRNPAYAIVTTLC